MAFLDAPYVAGIIDGEGSVLISKDHPDTKPCYTAKAIVTNTNLELIDSLMETFGGRKVVTHAGTFATKEVYQWRLCDKPSVKECLEIVLPWLLIKRAKAELVLEYLGQLTDYARRPIPLGELALRERYYQAVKEAA